MSHRVDHDELTEGSTMIDLVTILCGTCGDHHASVEAARNCALEMFDEWSEYLTLSYAESGGAIPHRTLSSNDRAWDWTFTDAWHKEHGEHGEPACGWLSTCTGPAVAEVDFQDHGDTCPVCPTHADTATQHGYRVNRYPTESQETS
jgi:hypothetical protein